MHCEICLSPKQIRTITDPEHLCYREGMQYHLYACTCPEYFIDELGFLKQHGIDLDDSTRMTLKYLLKRKYEYLNSHRSKLSMNDYDNLQVAKVSFERDFNNDKSANYHTVKDIQSPIWTLLYKLKRNNA